MWYKNSRLVTLRVQRFKGWVPMRWQGWFWGLTAQWSSLNATSKTLKPVDFIFNPPMFSDFDQCLIGGEFSTAYEIISIGCSCGYVWLTFNQVCHSCTDLRKRTCCLVTLFTQCMAYGVGHSVFSYFNFLAYRHREPHPDLIVFGIRRKNEMWLTIYVVIGRLYALAHLSKGFFMANTI